MSLTSTPVTSIPPGIGAFVDDIAHDLVDPLTLREQLVELRLSDHASQCGLGQLRRREIVVLDLYDGLGRIGDPEVDDRVHGHADIVLRDRVLRGDVQGHNPEIHLLHALDPERHQEDEAGALRMGQLSEPEDHAPLVLPEDPQAREDPAGRDDERPDEYAA